MKMRILTLLLAAVLLLTCLAGCSGGSDKETKTQVAMGTIQDGSYQNEFIGIGCKLDGNWTFLTEEEIREQNNIATDLLGEEYQELLEKAAVIYDMVATHSNGTDTLNVNMEKLSGAAKSLSEKAYVEASIDKTKDALGSMGLENVKAEGVELTFAGKTHYGMKIEGEISGLKCYETVVCVKCDGYMACITACTWNENTTQAILDKFSAA